MTPTPLCELAMKYSTDKCPAWHYFTGHSYTPYYHELFQHHRLDIERLLEIGICSNDVVGAGPSLRMWADYFPNAQIYGIDSCPWVMLNSNRIHSTLLDQSSAVDWDRFIKWAPTFDIIIDDGSHAAHDQILSANVLYPFLSPGGVYIIEDVQSDVASSVQSGILYPSRRVELNTQHRSDDRLIILRKESHTHA